MSTSPRLDSDGKETWIRGSGGRRRTPSPLRARQSSPQPVSPTPSSGASLPTPDEVRSALAASSPTASSVPPEECSECAAQRTLVAQLNGRLRVLRNELNRRDDTIAELRNQLAASPSPPTRPTTASPSTAPATPPPAPTPTPAPAPAPTAAATDLEEQIAALTAANIALRHQLDGAAAKRQAADKELPRLRNTVKQQQRVIVSAYRKLLRVVGVEMPASTLPEVVQATSNLPILVQHAEAQAAQRDAAGSVSSGGRRSRTPSPHRRRSSVPGSPTAAGVDATVGPGDSLEAQLDAATRERKTLSMRLQRERKDHSDKMKELHNTVLTLNKRILAGKAQVKDQAATLRRQADQLEDARVHANMLQMQLESDAAAGRAEVARVQELLQKETAAKDAALARAQQLTDAVKEAQERADAADRQVARAQAALSVTGMDPKDFATAVSSLKAAQLEAELKRDEALQLRAQLAAVERSNDQLRASLASSTEACREAQADAQRYEAQLTDLRWQQALAAGSASGARTRRKPVTPSTGSSPLRLVSASPASQSSAAGSTGGGPASASSPSLALVRAKLRLMRQQGK